MTIVVTGAGSGGHITPILAVAHELKSLEPNIRIVYIGQKGDKLSDIVENNPDIDKTYAISAGKLRRYYGAGIKQLLDIKTNAKNTKDLFRTVRGLKQSSKILAKEKPQIVFIKGGYIGVPVGLSAAIRGIPYITHDSDAVPGLANKIIAPWAKIHTTALPKDHYDYPSANTIEVGVPISSKYTYINDADAKKYKEELGLSKFSQIVLVTGGGLGAQPINKAMIKISPALLEKNKSLKIIHIAGRGNERSVADDYRGILNGDEQRRVEVLGFSTELDKYSGASDVIITRAGATNLAEYAVQGKACIVIPNPHLVGGHQLKNAQALADENAIKLVSEESISNKPEMLLTTIQSLLDSSEDREELGKNFVRLAHQDTAHELAKLLLSNVKKK